MMTAAVYDRYGPPDVLSIGQVPRPVPAADQVLVQVNASTVNRTDCGFRDPDPFFVRAFSGLTRPRRHTLGTEFAGVVTEVGATVTRFAPGDRVFGVNADRFGANAQYLAVAEDAPIALTPESLSDEEAAAVSDGFVLAWTCLTWGKVSAGQRLLLYGASGSIGTAGVQLAKHLGAEVTAVCPTPALETVRSLGADRVIDYLTEDFTAEKNAYDVVFDAVGQTTYGRCKGSLVEGGVFMSTDLGAKWQNIALSFTTRFANKRAMIPLPRYRQHHIEELKGLLETGAYQPVIDRTYPLEEVVEATRYVESKRKIGNVVLTISHDQL